MIVKPALEIRILVLFSWHQPPLAKIIPRRLLVAPARLPVCLIQFYAAESLSVLNLKESFTCIEDDTVQPVILSHWAKNLVFWNKRKRPDASLPLSMTRMFDSDKIRGERIAMLGATGENLQSRHFVAHLFRDFGGEPIVGDLVEGNFTIDEASLSLNRLHQDLHANPSRDSGGT